MLSKEPGSVCPSLSGGPSTKCRMHSGQLWPLEGHLVFRSEHSVPTLGVDGSFSFPFLWPFSHFVAFRFVSVFGAWTLDPADSVARTAVGVSVKRVT